MYKVGISCCQCMLDSLFFISTLLFETFNGRHESNNPMVVKRESSVTQSCHIVIVLHIRSGNEMAARIYKVQI